MRFLIVGLVAVGLLVGSLLPDSLFTVTPGLVLLVLVPGLVFEAALQLEVPHLRRTYGGIALLAAPGVLVSAVTVAAVLHAAAGIPFELGLVVGAMVAATDPVAVIATFRRLGSPRRLSTLVEAESLFNDGTALVLFAATVRAVQANVTVPEVAATAAITVAVSFALGLGAGWLGSRPIAVSHDHRVELLLSLLVAYGTYLVADALHQSGIIATVVAGVVIGNRGRRLGLDAEAREALDLAWERIALILTAFAFVLVGLAISVADLAGAATAILWGVVAIVVGRIVVVYGLLGGVSRLLQDRTHLGDIPMGWLHVLFWAGLRGAVAVAMALALPTDFPERTLLQEITFGIVLFTLLVQGTTAEWVVARATRSRDPQPHGPPPEPRPSG